MTSQKLLYFFTVYSWVFKGQTIRFQKHTRYEQFLSQILKRSLIEKYILEIYIADVYTKHDFMFFL